MVAGKRLSAKKVTDIRKQIQHTYKPVYCKLVDSDCSQECSESSDNDLEQEEEEDASPSQHII